MSEEAKEDLKKLVREEMKNVLDNYEFKFQKEEEEKHEKEPEEKCEGCGTKITGKPKYCPGCDEELNWPETGE